MKRLFMKISPPLTQLLSLRRERIESQDSSDDCKLKESRRLSLQNSRCKGDTIAGLQIEDCSICMNRAEPNDLLCHDCRLWDDARHAFRCEARWTTTLKNILSKNSHCIVCTVMGEAVYAYQQAKNLPRRAEDVKVFIGGPYHDSYSWYKSDWSDFKSREPVFRCMVYVLVGSSDTNTVFCGPPNPPDLCVQLILHYGSNGRRLQQAERWERPYFDIESLKGWIDCCKADHPGCSADSEDLPQCFRAIDVKHRCIVDSAVSFQYVALSYTWSSVQDKDIKLETHNHLLLTTSGSLSTSELPPVILDAMQLCEDLGQQYLWVDRLCIIQDNELDKGLQINKMHNIYDCAVFTIIASTNEGRGLPGVSGRPRASSVFRKNWLFESEVRQIRPNFDATIAASQWSTRGWTFQEELLARRKIFISDHQIYFTCRENIIREETGTEKRQLRSRKLQHRQIVSENDLNKCIEDYTSRQLTYPMDILLAFTGVANMLGDKSRHGRFWFGLREWHLSSSLLWGHLGPIEPRQSTNTIPTWSWAAWIGKISYDRLSYGLCRTSSWSDVGSLVQFYRIESNMKSDLCMIADKTQWFGMDFEPSSDQELQSLPENEKAAYFPDERDQPTMLWKDCPHNPWSVLHQHPHDMGAVAAARQHGNGLIFNSTVGYLLLNKPRRSKLSNCQGDELLSIDILDSKFHNIGSLMDMDEEWIRLKIAPKAVHEFVVLCAGILQKSARRELWSRSLEFGEHFDPWLLHVMLIERDESCKHLCRRVALGVIYTRYWAEVAPKWETIVLV